MPDVSYGGGAVEQVVRAGGCQPGPYKGGVRLGGGEYVGRDGDVATAADAWLTEPWDTGVYVRLVQAIAARRAY